VPLLGNLHACAGVAICRTHAPVLRVYELSGVALQGGEEEWAGGTGRLGPRLAHRLLQPDRVARRDARRQYGRGVTMQPIGSALPSRPALALAVGRRAGHWCRRLSGRTVVAATIRR
jgi:hypothetical protein